MCSSCAVASSPYREASRSACTHCSPRCRCCPRSSDPEWTAHIVTAEQRGDREAIARSISDEVLDRFAFAGDPDDLLRLIERAREAGASRVELGTPHGLDAVEGIRLLGSHVLPARQSR